MSNRLFIYSFRHTIEITDHIFGMGYIGHTFGSNLELPNEQHQLVKRRS